MNTKWILISAGLVTGASLGADYPAGGNTAAELLGAPMTVGELASQDGRAGEQQYPPLEPHGTATNTGRIDNNSLVSTTTGVNTVGSDGFSQINGIGTLIQNSGNQVIIQNSTILNLSLY